MKKAITYEELQELGRQNYCHGGDVFIECWDQRDFDEYVEMFGPITREDALAMCRMYDDEWKAHRAEAEACFCEADNQVEKPAQEEKPQKDLPFSVVYTNDAGETKTVWTCGTREEAEQFEVSNYGMWLDEDGELYDTRIVEDPGYFEKWYNEDDPEDLLAGDLEDTLDLLLEEKDYGPSNPWDAPGMSVSDFISGVSYF